MERKRDGKLRILYLKDILSAHCGAEKAVTMAELLSALALCGVDADRRSVYDDIRQLRVYGLNIGRRSGGRYSAYYLVRQAENPITHDRQTGKKSIY